VRLETRGYAWQISTGVFAGEGDAAIAKYRFGASRVPAEAVKIVFMADFLIQTEDVVWAVASQLDRAVAPPGRATREQRARRNMDNHLRLDRRKNESRRCRPGMAIDSRPAGVLQS
jgi:hypothetical protein